MIQEGRCGTLEWAACATAYPGQLRSGDAFLVQETEAGVLVAVVDGLGHGDEAADAAAQALASLGRTAGRSLVHSLTACHDTLRGSRGAVMTLAVLDPDRSQLAWLAVGNVDAVVLRRPRWGLPRTNCAVTLRAGVVGDRLPPLHEATVAMAAGDTLIAVTDGIFPSFLDNVDLSLDARTLAGRVHRGYSRTDDDALVLVARSGTDRWTGPPVTVAPSNR